MLDGVDAVDSPTDWQIFDKAADATFANLPTYTGKAFTRDDWDQLFGPCEAVTDVASMFAPQLIEAYPEAKIVLVRRDIERWYKSLDESVLKALWGPVPEFFVSYVEPLLGSVAGPANRKIMYGFFGALDVETIRANARDKYRQHYEQIKEKVPAENLLEFNLADGWEPLCKFLGKEVPDMPFPHANEAAALRQKIVRKQMTMLQSVVFAPARFAARLIGW
ncbi:putative nad dependent epimerase protein [Phaeoacremonium minimum UCRPA7]|uniref:Putative nad dependent epimerase protein n=1 Tax=Phaeoacremonium minimum (strain UCR-PA7) TaxID=1286976 RepID=R8BMH2_PHAM7|nr:putative nad dependent epimerase protein [Phaeoacremonium minimum UCRPA7]EOO00527.1 putative nad dependent epimerase protein [Phaeoacremonium minimum UCRPA7]